MNNEFSISTKYRKFTGKIYDQNKSRLNTALEIENALQSSDYLIVSGNDEARLPVEEIQKYILIKQEPLFKVSTIYPFNIQK